MSAQELHGPILEVLYEIAPELEEEEIGADTDLRQDLDLDSMDFLNFVIGVHKKFDVEIPEEDYAQLTSLAGCASYVHKRQADS